MPLTLRLSGHQEASGSAGRDGAGLVLASLAASHLIGNGPAGDVLMFAAAVATGLPIAVKATRALAAKVVSIDLLVAVTAVGDVVAAVARAGYPAKASAF